MLTRKIQRFGTVYALVALAYYLFDLVYLPWLTYVFGYWVFLPLYPSILLVNFVGLFVYDYFDEDVFFIEFGKNWIAESGGRLESIKRNLRTNRNLIFISLSIWPSPIASYIFFRKEHETIIQKIKIIALGSIFCTAAWGGGLSFLYFIIAKTFYIFQGKQSF